MKLEDGRAFLYQWDTGRKLIIEEPCSKVSFSNAVSKPLDVEVKDGVALIPNELLQMSFPLQCWAFVGTPETGYTRKHESFQIYARPKPADYVFTPTQQLTISQLIERIERVEDPAVIKTVVEDYLKQNPVEAPVMSVNDKTGAVKLNAADVGALAASSLPSAINTAAEYNELLAIIREKAALVDKLYNGEITIDAVPLEWQEEIQRRVDERIAAEAAAEAEATEEDYINALADLGVKTNEES